MFKIIVLIFILKFFTVNGQELQFPKTYEEDGLFLYSLAVNISTAFTSEFKKYMNSSSTIRSAMFDYLVNGLRHKEVKKTYLVSDIMKCTPKEQFFLCTMCYSVANIILERNKDEPVSTAKQGVLVKELLMELCDLVNFSSRKTCSDLFDSNWQNLVYTLESVTIKYLEPDFLCSTILQYGYCQNRSIPHTWEIKIDSWKKFTATKSSNAVKSEDDIYILHINGIQYDSLYKKNSSTECSEPICCREGTISTGDAAGTWGYYQNCDTPWKFLYLLLRYIKEKHKNISFIYNTGNVVAHIPFSLGEKTVWRDLRKVYSELRRQFPTKKIVSCLGDLDTYLPNNWSGSNKISKAKKIRFYEEFLDYNKQFHNGEAMTEQNGNLTYLLKEKLRIVVLNNIEAYVINWKFYRNGFSEMPQLQWLHDTLLKAEEKGEYVHILQHLEPGNGECWSAWAKTFNSIVTRFYKTISGVFYGHTNLDDFKVFYTENGKHAINVGWSGGSISPYNNKNPNYRIYRVDPKTFQVIDADTYYVDLIAANENKRFRPIKLYNFNNLYTNSCSPAGLNKLLTEFALYPEKLRTYYFNTHARSNNTIKRGCSMKCMIDTLTSIPRTSTENCIKCEHLNTILGASLSKIEKFSGASCNDAKSTRFLVVLNLGLIFQNFFG